MEVQICNTNKMIRKEASYIGWGLLVHSAISFIVVVFSFIVAGVWVGIHYPDAITQDAILEQVIAQCEASGTASIIGVCLGLTFLFFFFRKRVGMSAMMQKRKEMHLKTFLPILCIFLGGQLLFQISGELLEKGLNLVGYSAMQSIEAASDTSTTISMFLYVSFIGPIVEEIIYRGFVLRSLEKYGKLTAIVISSLLFGIMHANIPQGVFAFGVGLVLGYVAVEYSIGWAIALHIINNCIFSEILGFATSGLSEQMQNTISMGIFLLFAVAAAIILWKKRKYLKTFIIENRTAKRIYLHLFTGAGIVVFTVVELFMAIVMLEKI